MTKTELINKICEMNPKYKNKRGRLYYMYLNQLEKLYQKVKKKYDYNDNNNTFSGLQTN